VPSLRQTEIKRPAPAE